LAGETRVVLLGLIDRLCKGLEQSLYHMVRFLAIEQFQMQVAPGLVGEGLEKFPRQPKAEGAGHILDLFRGRYLSKGQLIQTSPDQVGPPAEINDTSRQTLVHGHIGLAAKRVLRVEAGAVAADAGLVAQRFTNGLAQGEATIFDRMVGVHLEVAFAAQPQVHQGMFGKERKHVVKERDAGPDRGLASAVQLHAQADVRLVRDPLQFCLARLHRGVLNRLSRENQSQFPKVRPVQELRQFDGWRKSGRAFLRKTLKELARRPRIPGVETQHTDKTDDPRNQRQEREEFIPTRRSLLSRLRNLDDNDSWRDFFEIYWKLIYSTARKAALSDDEAQEVVQETMLTITRKIQDFRYDPARGSFKGWLKHTTWWRIQDQFRKRRPGMNAAEQSEKTLDADEIEQIPDPAGPGVDAVWEADWRRNLMDAAIQKVKKKVQPKHFQVFELYALKDLPAARVAKLLGVNVALVHLIKHRVGNSIRQELQRLERDRI
jgi:RNA polymerase sigma factor (sigma-70 family)